MQIIHILLVGRLEISLTVIIKSTHRKAQILRRVQKGGKVGFQPVVAAAGPQVDFSTLVGERVLGEHTHQAGHGVAAVNRALRPAQHVNTVDVQQFNVVGTFVGISHVVYVQSHGRGVDARTDAAHINGRRKARTVVG